MSLTAAEKENLRDQIADRLVEMESMFDPRCKLAFVMRAPHLLDGDIIVTNDDPKLVIKAIERLAGYEVIAHPDAKLAAGTEQTAPAKPPHVVVKSLADWLRDSLRSRLLFGRHDEPLDFYGLRLVRVILTEVEAADGRSSAPAPQPRLGDTR